MLIMYILKFQLNHASPRKCNHWQSIMVMIRFFKHLGFVVCACKHHILTPVTRIKPDPGFTRVRAPKENGILRTGDVA